ncbi:MAG: tetratricopeptide repeat protein [Roseiflexaceae bacterium]
MGEMSLSAAYELMRHAVREGEQVKVASIARHVLQYFPHNIKAKLYLGEALVAAGLHSEARTTFLSVCESDPENFVALVGLSAIAEQTDQLSDAIYYLERAIEMRPDMSDIRTRLASMYQRTAKDDQYLQMTRVGLGRLFVRGRMFEQAIDEFQKLRAIHPDRLDIIVALAESLWRNGDEHAAYDVCVQAIEHAPQLLKANFIIGRYQTHRDATQSAHYWQQAQLYDPMLETAKELFGDDALPSASGWVLPEWDTQSWQQDAFVKSFNQAQVKYISTEVVPTIRDSDVQTVLEQMGQMGYEPAHDHAEDCACLDVHEVSHDSTGMLVQRTLERHASMQTDDTRTLSVPADAMSAQVTELSPVVTAATFIAGMNGTTTEDDNRDTTPVVPDQDEVVTEPVSMSPSEPVFDNIPFTIPDEVTDDDRFLMTVLQKQQADAESVVSHAAPIDRFHNGRLRIHTDQIRIINSSDDLYGMLARLEIAHQPSPTEDLREVIARTLGGGLIERPRILPPRDLVIPNPSTPAVVSVTTEPKSPTPVAVPREESARSEALLANLLSQPHSGLTEGMRGLSAALPRVDHSSNDDSLDEVLTDTTSDAITETTSDDETLLSLLEHPEEVMNVKSAAGVFDGIAVSRGMRLHDFGDQLADTAVDVTDMLREIGLTTGEISSAQVNQAVINTGPLPPSQIARNAPNVPAKSITVSEPVRPADVQTPPRNVREIQPSGNEAIDSYLRALKADPENVVLRLSVARVAVQCNMFDTAMSQYRALVHNNALLDDVIVDLRDLLHTLDESYLRRECHRILGTAYSRQGKMAEAVAAFRMTKSSGAPPVI